MFYVMLALRAELRTRKHFDKEPNLGTLTDLVALGTIADVVPLDANNRNLVSQGLKRLRAGRGQPGVAALRAGRIGMVTVHVPDGLGASFETIRGDLRRFWRRPRALERYP